MQEATFVIHCPSVNPKMKLHEASALISASNKIGTNRSEGNPSEELCSCSVFRRTMYLLSVLNSRGFSQ